MSWIKFEDQKPDTKEYVLVHTPYCKYSALTARWNGKDWLAVDEVEILNVEYWMELPKNPELVKA